MSQIIDSRNAPVSLRLTGSRVMPAFRSALFDAANRAGCSINEFVLRATAAELARHGAELPGVFVPGDLQLDEAA